jgi:hypothetical protein
MSRVFRDVSNGDVPARFERGDFVCTSLIGENGIRVKGVFEIARTRFNANRGAHEYQLSDPHDKKLYKRGEWIREKNLKLDRGGKEGRFTNQRAYEAQSVSKSASKSAETSTSKAAKTIASKSRKTPAAKSDERIESKTDALDMEQTHKPAAIVTSDDPDVSSRRPSRRHAHYDASDTNFYSSLESTDDLGSHDPSLKRGDESNSHSNSESAFVSMILVLVLTAHVAAQQPEESNPGAPMAQGFVRMGTYDPEEEARIAEWNSAYTPKEDANSKKASYASNANAAALGLPTDENIGKDMLFIRGTKPADFKKPGVMAKVRKQAMDSYLQKDNGPTTPTTAIKLANQTQSTYHPQPTRAESQARGEAAAARAPWTSNIKSPGNWGNPAIPRLFGDGLGEEKAQQAHAEKQAQGLEAKKRKEMEAANRQAEQTREIRQELLRQQQQAQVIQEQGLEPKKRKEMEAANRQAEQTREIRQELLRQQQQAGYGTEQRSLPPFSIFGKEDNSKLDPARPSLFGDLARPRFFGAGSGSSTSQQKHADPGYATTHVDSGYGTEQRSLPPFSIFGKEDPSKGAYTSTNATSQAANLIKLTSQTLGDVPDPARPRLFGDIARPSLRLFGAGSGSSTRQQKHADSGYDNTHVNSGYETEQRSLPPFSIFGNLPLPPFSIFGKENNGKGAYTFINATTQATSLEKDQPQTLGKFGTFNPSPVAHKSNATDPISEDGVESTLTEVDQPAVDFDTETIYSVGSRADHAEKLYIHSFVTQLAVDIKASTGFADVANIPSSYLESALKSFTLQLHEGSSNPFQWNTAVSLHRSRE